MNALPNMLIVDDLRENLVSLEISLEKLNVNLIQARSGSEALEKTRGIELALAIIDVRMPVMNGYELASKINEERSDDKVPVLFLTASHVNDIDLLKGYGSGAVDYIFKPVDDHILLSKINMFLEFFKRKQSIIRENTQRKEMEEALREYQVELEIQNNELTLAISKARVASLKYSELYDFAPSGYFTLSPEKTILELNYSGAQMLCMERVQITGRNFGSFVSADTQPVFNDFVQNVYKNKAKEICEVTLETDDGQSKYAHIEGMIAGNATHCLINVVDITSRRRAELAIKVSEEKYRTMLNASPDGILLVGLNGIIDEVSEIGLELFGAGFRDEMVGKNLSQFVPSDEIPTLLTLLERALNEGLVQNAGLRIRKKNRSVFAAETSITLIQGPDLTPLSLMVIIRDISQRKKMEAKQMHADRMASLGEMASGIAHEINQPLNIISMVMDKILYESAKTETVDIGLIKSKSEKIFENIIRIRNIIDHIRAFSRSHDDYILIPFDINLSIRNAISMIAEQFTHLGISINLQLEEQIPQISGNTYKFEQVIINLLVNAKDAVIELKRRQKKSPEMIVGIRSFHENQYIIVEVTDNGIGIKNENINNVILPFYTTKAEGKGTGLGLSICYQIIKEMEGTIEITSNKDQGTKIKLVLNIDKKQ